jgi:hypothetical protein
MNDDDLLNAAARAAGEPVADGPADPELEHAMQVLRAASVPADSARRAGIMKPAPVIKLHYFAAAAVVFFCIGLVTLFKVSFTPPTPMNGVAVVNTANVGGGGSIKPDNDAGRYTGGDDTQPEVTHVRPQWVLDEAKRIKGTRPTGGTGRVGSPAGGGSPGLGSGGGDAAGGGSGGSTAPRATPQQKLHDLARSAGVSLFSLKGRQHYMDLKEVSTVEPADAVGLQIVRLRYASYHETTVVLLQAPDSPAARAALSPEGLAVDCILIKRDGVLLLVLSNVLPPAELAKLEFELVE